MLSASVTVMFTTLYNFTNIFNKKWEKVHIIFNIARNKIRNASLASGSMSGVRRLIDRLSSAAVYAIASSWPLVAPMTADEP